MRSPASREARGAPLFRTSDRREQLPRGERRPLSSEVGHGPSYPTAIPSLDTPRDRRITELTSYCGETVAAVLLSPPFYAEPASS
jgi:hypothetical protein